MINTIIICVLSALFAASLITALAEPIFRRNSIPGRFFRAIRIRLREISLTSFCVSAVVLLVLGLAFGCESFTAIWLEILLIFGILCVLLPGDLIPIYSSRKKAKPGKLAGVLSEAAEDTSIAALAKELTPLEANEENV